MNTKDYIENKKNKKLANILKGALATGLVVGSMLTSTACKPNQPHESSSNTNTIETTSTIATTNIEDTIVKTDEQVEKFNKTMQSITGEDIEPKNQVVILHKRINKEDNTETPYMIICKRIDNTLHPLMEVEISKSNYDYIALLYKRVANLSEEDMNRDLGFSSYYLTKNFDDKTLQIITNVIQEQESINQSSQDDLVR